MDKKFGRLYIDYIYEYVVKRVESEKNIEIAELQIVKEILEKEIFTRCFKSLLYCMNLERVENKLEGNTPEKRYEYFSNTECCISSMEENFPTIKEQIYEEMSGKLLFVYNVINNFFHNQKSICQHFFGTVEDEIVSINNSGDWHDDKCVMIFSFKSQNKIVFKPSKGDNINFLKGFFQFFFDKNYIELYDSMYTGDGVWVKYVDHIEIFDESECEEFYFNYGKIVFVSYVLGINDMHYENLIAHKTYPVVTDVETIFSSYLFFNTHNFEYDAQYNAVKKLLYGVMATGLVPIFSMTEYFGGDVSCLSNKGIKVIVEKVKNEYRDDMSIYTLSEIINHYTHLPNCKVEPLMYGKQIIEGFDEAERIFREQQEDIINYITNNYTKVESRIILNMTKGYSKILRIKSDPRYRFKPELFRQLLGNLKRNNQFNESVYAHEVEELCTSNIPSFYWNAVENCVYGRHANSIKKIMEVNGVNRDALIEIVNEQTTSEVLMEQKKLIKDSIMSSIVLGVEHQNKIDVRKENSFNNINNIFLKENINENRIIGGDGTISWIGLMVNDKEQLEYAILDWSLYSGVIGVGYMYLSEYILTKDELSLEIIKRIYLTIVKAYEKGTFDEYNISYYCGLTGIYAFLKKIKDSNIIQHNHVEKQIEKIKDLIRKNLVKTSCYDTLSGIHSALIYFFSEYKNNKFSEEMIFSISQYFMNKFDIDIMEKDFNYASFAHGYSGVMTSVMCMNSVNHIEEYVDIVRQLWEKEKVLYQGEFKWIDKRNDRELYSHFWCHGSCGIMLSRLIWKKYGFLNNGILDITEEQLTEMLLNYKERIENNEYNSQNNSLCHGNFAFIDYLISSEKILNTPINEVYCVKTINIASEQGYSCVGAPGAINAIGFMVGESGIQYLLNRYRNKELSSVLVMENL